MINLKSMKISVKIFFILNIYLYIFFLNKKILKLKYQNLAKIK